MGKYIEYGDNLYLIPIKDKIIGKYYSSVKRELIHSDIKDKVKDSKFIYHFVKEYNLAEYDNRIDTIKRSIDVNSMGDLISAINFICFIEHVLDFMFYGKTCEPSMYLSKLYLKTGKEKINLRYNSIDFVGDNIKNHKYIIIRDNKCDFTTNDFDKLMKYASKTDEILVRFEQTAYKSYSLKEIKKYKLLVMEEYLYYVYAYDDFTDKYTYDYIMSLNHHMREDFLENSYEADYGNLDQILMYIPFINFTPFIINDLIYHKEIKDKVYIYENHSYIKLKNGKKHHSSYYTKKDDKYKLNIKF